MTTIQTAAVSNSYGDDNKLSDDPLWFKDAIIYEIHIRAFQDSTNDGIGDIAGLIARLDYLSDLGVTALWLLPFYPSPLKDGGYDIADYTNVHEHYGTREDFQRLLVEAHRRGIRVITELVLNHTSSEHPWFQAARRAPAGSPERELYVWSDTPAKYEDTRIIFKDFESSNWSWDPIAKAYYWHRFYSHQPDLNFDNPAVHTALFKVIDFWMEMGVDGVRLDAVPYLYEREGTSCENLPETHEFLKLLRAHIDGKFKNRMLLAEANQWPADAAAYFGEGEVGDECHMNFHFPLMPRMFMAIETEDSFPIINILKRTPAIPANCQWATFLRNHDELTLEMVTDEDRDTMYRGYAAERAARINLGIRRRLAPLLGTRPKIELMNALLLSLPGTPVIYYGDEIGMGDNIYLGDRDGVRTPMQWSADRNGGFSKANPQMLYLPAIIDPAYHYEAVNVEAQQANPASLLWWMKRLLAKRKEHRVFGRGTIEFMTGDNPRVLSFVRELDGETVLVIANLSRFVQATRLHLERFKGTVPTELFGRMRFPQIPADAPYFVSLGPYSFYWLSLETPAGTAAAAELPTLRARAAWTELLAPAQRTSLARTLLSYAVERRWFRSKARIAERVSITDVINLGTDARTAIALLRVEYDHGAAETYVMPLAFAEDGDAVEPARAESAHLTIAKVTLSAVPGRDGAVTGVLYDALAVESFDHALLTMMLEESGAVGQIGRVAGRAFEPLKAEHDTAGALVPHATSAEQTNSGVIYGDRFMLKLLRVLEEGPSTEFEVARFLSTRTPPFHGAPQLAGVLEYRQSGREPSTIGTLFQFVPNQGDAWQLTLEALSRYFDRVLADSLGAAATGGTGGARPTAPGQAGPEAPRSASPTGELPVIGASTIPPRPSGSLVERAHAIPPPQVIDWIGPFLDRGRLLGTRTAELHIALASDTTDPLFAPEPYDILHQQSIYGSVVAHAARTFDILRNTLPNLEPDTRELAESALAHEAALDRALARVTRRRIDVLRIRVHGDYHLGQVLWTGEDFVIIDFEGEPGRPLSQRRFKRCPLRDVAGMLRSLQYAAQSALHDGRRRPEDLARLEPWADAWAGWMGGAFLAGYLERATGQRFLPRNDGDLALLLEFFLLEKCVYEIGYELNNRPDWVAIPLRGLLALIENAS